MKIMDPVVFAESSKQKSSSMGRRQLKLVFVLIVGLKTLQASQCFVPRVLKTTAYVHRAFLPPTHRAQQQTTHLNALKNNEGAQVGIGPVLVNSNSTEYMGTLQPRKARRGHVSDRMIRDSPLKVSEKAIESTVNDMLKPSALSIGLLGERVEEISPKLATHRLRVLGKLSKSSSSIIAREATPMDDLKIANLRLSVFSNFNPESRKLFCERSCQLLSSRRRRGATCVIAAMKKNSNDETESKTGLTGHEQIVGTAEISFHEFEGTQLGRCRPKGSILYVTEVAVDATRRRNGIAKLMMEAIDNIANSRKTETIYLHVDVTNLGAINLYKRAGYTKVEYNDPTFLEFTTKLNLHDGATKGRNHHLMAKDLGQTTWLTNEKQSRCNEESYATNSQQQTLGIDIMSTV